MKYSECNARQKKAFMNILHAANWHIGGLENTVSDFYGEPEGINAQEALNNHNRLVADIYDLAISEVYSDGSCSFGPSAERYLKDIRFCGKEWLMARVDARVRKMGY